MISSGTETVYVKNQGDEEVIGENTSSFTITASFDADSITNNEVKPVDPIWECTYEGATFVPTEGVEPPPQNPGDPTVDDLIASTASSPNSNSWTTKVSSGNVGQWLLKFKVTVTYSKQDQNTGQTIPGETFGPYSDENTFAFIATTKDWKVLLSSDGVVCRHSTKPAKRPTIKVTATLKDSGRDQQAIKFTSSSTGGKIKFGRTTDNATEDFLLLPVSKSDPTTFYISGEKESTKMNDVTIYASDHTLKVKGSTSVTVLWVTIKINTTGETSKDNDKRATIMEQYNNETNLGEQILVWTEKNDQEKIMLYVQACFFLEASGSVLPKDFVSPVVLRRDAAGAEKNFATGQYTIDKRFQQEIGVVTKKVKDKYPDDTGPDECRDDTPSNIYNFDAAGPGRGFETTQYDDIREYKSEFKQYFRVFAAYNDEERCSDIIAYMIVHKVHFQVNINANKIPVPVVREHDSTLTINPNNSNNENDFYDFDELKP